MTSPQPSHALSQSEKRSLPQTATLFVTLTADAIVELAQIDCYLPVLRRTDAA
jgi:hypothetical protein